MDITVKLEEKEILQAISDYLAKTIPLEGKKVAIDGTYSYGREMEVTISDQTADSK